MARLISSCGEEHYHVSQWYHKLYSILMMKFDKNR